MLTFNESSDVLVTTVLIPLFLLTLRTLLGAEVNYWMTLIWCYFHRPFDLDNDPDSHDWLMIFNQASGVWECCSLTFHFGLRKGGNGAFVHHYDETWNHLFTERIPFSRWKDTGKATLGDVELRKGLLEKIQRMKLQSYDC